MRKHIKDYFIPHEGNDHKPHMVRDASIVALTTILVLTFGFSVFQALLIRTSIEFTAAVVPGVLVDLANKDREAEGLSDLTVSPILEKAARMKAEHMAENEYFAHTSPDGLNPWYWFYRAGYNFVNAGENLAVNFVDSGDVEQAWMNSPGHRENIMNGTFTEIGIAAVPGQYKDRKTIFVVQLFGTPAQVAVAPVIAQTAPTLAVASTQEVQGATVAVAQQTVSEPVVVQEVTPTAVTQVPAPAPEGAQDVSLAQEFTPARDANTAGASVKEEVIMPVERISYTNAWEKFLAQPRAVVRWGYIIIGLALAFVTLLMVLFQVHKRHSREFSHGIALIILIVFLSYFNYLLLAKDLLIV
ncbi:MAG: CAP domain-containing protein [Candidatus Campbellbacteria bacterium]|nr:CAP domain-containing protein [Candidatus Campbellbacteria bacterium]